MAVWMGEGGKEYRERKGDREAGETRGRRERGREEVK